MPLPRLSDSYVSLLHTLSCASKRAGGKVSVLETFARWPLEGQSLTADHLHELCQRGLINMGDGYYWLPEYNNTSPQDSLELVDSIVRAMESDLELPYLFRTVPMSHIPSKLRFSFARRYYAETSEQLLLRFADYLLTVTGKERKNDPAYLYHLTMLFSETVTDAHIPLERLGVIYDMLDARYGRSNLEAQRGRLVRELELVDQQLATSKYAGNGESHDE